MENNQNPNQPENAKKPDKGGLIIIGIVAVIIIAVIIYFVVQNSGGNSGGTAAQPPENMGELLELNDLNIHGSWFRDEADGSRYEIRFSANNVLHFYMYDAEGNTVAESDEGAYETENDKLYLSIIADGAVYEDICTAMVSINVLFISADEGTGLFNGTYLSEYQVPDDSGEKNGNDSQSETTTTETTTTTTVTEPPATEPAIEFHLPTIVDELFNLTAEEYYGNNVPTTNVDMVSGLAEYDIVYTVGHVVTVGYSATNINYDYFTGTGTGYPLWLSFDVHDIFPDLDSCNYYRLQDMFGNVHTEENMLFGGYDVWTEVDGYTLSFNVDTLDEELTSCIISNPNPVNSTVQEEYHLPEAVKEAFDLTIEEFYADLGYVPPCDRWDWEDLTDYVDLIEPGLSDFYAENGYRFYLAFYPATTDTGATIDLGFDWYESDGEVIGTGQTLMVKCRPTFLFPEVDHVTYDFLVNKFGDRLVTELENTSHYANTPYLVHVDIDGYRIFLEKWFSLETLLPLEAYVFPLEYAIIP